MDSAQDEGSPDIDEDSADIELDTRGLRCPLPVIRLGQAARELGSGTITLLADDPATKTDVPAWCRLRSAELLEQTDGPAYRFVIRVTDQSGN